MLLIIMNIKRKVGVFLAYLMQFLIAVFLITAIYKRQYAVIFVSLLALFVTFIPLMLKHKWKFTLPWHLNFLITLSLFLYVAGTVFGWYHAYHYLYYDKIGHFLGSLTVALLGFTSVLIIDWYTEVELTDKSIIVFVIMFTLAIGALWEIVEFTTDLIFATNAQYDGLHGTMLDLIFDLAGGIVAGFIGIFLLKHGRKTLLEKMFDKVIKKIK